MTYSQNELSPFKTKQNNCYNDEFSQFNVNRKNLLHEFYALASPIHYHCNFQSSNFNSRSTNYKQVLGKDTIYFDTTSFQK